MELAELAWRDGVLLLVASAAVYLIIMLLRLTQIGRRRTTIAPPEPTAPPAAPPPVPPAARKPPLAEADDHQTRAPMREAPRAAAAVQAQNAASPSAFVEHLQWAALDAEVGRMRQDLQALSEEVQVLRRELAMINSSRHVSPHYAEAMTLAQRGHAPQDVADRCGISLGEAELVIALARGPRAFAGEEDDYGEPGYGTGR